MTASIANPSSVAKVNALYGKRATLKKIQAAATSGHEISLSARGKKIDPVILRQTLEEISPDLAQLVPDPKGAHASLRIAARRCQNSVGKHYEWREVGVSGGRLAFALAKKSAVVGQDAATTSLATVDEARVMVDETSGSFDVDVSSPDLTTHVARLQVTYEEERGTLDCNGLWHVVMAVAKATGEGCVSVVEGSVLVQSVEGLEKLQASFDTAWVRAYSHDNGPILLCRKVTFEDGGSTLNGGMARAVENSLMADAETLLSTLETRIAQSEASGRALRADSVSSFIASVTALADQTGLFGKLLGKRADKLLAATEALKKQAEEAALKSWAAADLREAEARKAGKPKPRAKAKAVTAVSVGTVEVIDALDDPQLEDVEAGVSP